jgi:hypothetical protein
MVRSAMITRHRSESPENSANRKRRERLQTAMNANEMNRSLFVYTGRKGYIQAAGRLRHQLDLLSSSYSTSNRDVEQGKLSTLLHCLRPIRGVQCRFSIS